LGQLLTQAGRWWRIGLLGCHAGKFLQASEDERSSMMGSQGSKSIELSSAGNCFQVKFGRTKRERRRDNDIVLAP